MDNNTTLSFRNRRFIKIEVILILLIIVAIIVQAIYFDNRYFSALIIVWLAVRFSTPLAHRYIIDGDKLVLKFYLKRNKVFNIADILEMNVILSLKDIEVEEIIEEIIKRG